MPEEQARKARLAGNGLTQRSIARQDISEGEALTWQPQADDAFRRPECMAEGVRFELTRERNPLPVFKTGALNHSATLPLQ
jgi:hypothetical protein